MKIKIKKIIELIISVTRNSRSRAVRAARAQQRATRLAPIVGALEKQGLGLRAIARELEQRRIPTARGGSWTATQVKRIKSGIGFGS